jgi:hypothetical protein
MCVQQQDPALLQQVLEQNQDFNPLLSHTAGIVGPKT